MTLLTTVAAPETTTPIGRRQPTTTTTTPLRVRTYPFADPAGLTRWREAEAARQVDASFTESQVRQILEGVRRATDRDVLAEDVALTAEQVMNVVAGVGSRLGQANKSGTRATACLSAPRGARLGLPPGVHRSYGETVVVLAPGWGRTRKAPRDISRSYAAIAVSDPARDDQVLERWLATTHDEVPVTYQHLAHLYAVARGTFPTLEGISTDAHVQRAYLSAYDTLVAAIRRAHQQLAVALDPQTSPVRCLMAVRQCFWLSAALTGPLGTLARSASAGDERALAALPVARARLRDGVERQPRLFFPRSIGELSQEQFRALCSLLGFPVPMDDEGTTDETGERALIAALAQAKQRAGHSA